MTVSYISRKHCISPSPVFRGKKLVSEGGKQVVKADEQVVASADARTQEKRVRELERVPGKKTLENETLKEAANMAHQKTFISWLPSIPDENSP
jgi:transposase